MFRVGCQCLLATGTQSVPVGAKVEHGEGHAADALFLFPRSNITGNGRRPVFDRGSVTADSNRDLHRHRQPHCQPAQAAGESESVRPTRELLNWHGWDSENCPPPARSPAARPAGPGACAVAGWRPGAVVRC